MKKFNKSLILIIGIMLTIVSYIFDEQVNLFFKNISFTFLNPVLSVISNFGILIAVMLVIPSLIFYKLKRKNLAYLLLLTFIVSFILAFVIKLIVLRSRPMGAFTFPFINITDYSFPSMHAMVAFSLLPVLIKYLPKQRIFLIIFAFLVGFSRIYFGIHFLSDVVFGAFAGYLIGDCIMKLHEKRKLWSK